MILEVKNNKGNRDVNIYASKHSKSSYHNIIDKDPKKIAQVLIDLMFEGFPIDKAVEIFRARVHKRDWLGL